jgi:hypothetical protein
MDAALFGGKIRQRAGMHISVVRGIVLAGRCKGIYNLYTDGGSFGRIDN